MPNIVYALTNPESTDGQGWTGRGHWKGERK